MAQKAAKAQAARNSARLNQTHLITLAIHLIFLTIRSLRRTLTTRSVALYLGLSAPGLIIEFWLERIGRPSYGAVTEGFNAGPGELKRSGEDLDAQGLTEFLWDVLYWTWGCVALAGMVGDGAWSLWLVIPLYAAYSAWQLYSGTKSSLGLGGSPQTEDAQQGSATGVSKRQQKMEKRGGQKMQYR